MTQIGDVIATFATELIEEGTGLQDTQFTRATSSFSKDTFVDLQAFHKWRTSCRVLLTQLGTFAEPWHSLLGVELATNTLTTVKGMIGALESIRDNAKRGRIAALEDLVFAEAFANLVDQGDYLLSKGYLLAAAVIYRAVLEERLRRMCETHQCTIGKDRPTIADHNQALYKGDVYDKIVMKSVDAMSVVGNAAAHADPCVKQNDVERFRDNLLGFLGRCSAI